MRQLRAPLMYRSLRTSKYRVKTKRQSPLRLPFTPTQPFSESQVVCYTGQVDVAGIEGNYIAVRVGHCALIDWNAALDSLSLDACTK
jgi:hypothetical protein